MDQYIDSIWDSLWVAYGIIYGYYMDNIWKIRQHMDNIQIIYVNI
jgi:hypothetical protein